MSGVMTALVWRAKGLEEGERLLLLALADEATSFGACHLSLQMLARKADLQEGEASRRLEELSRKKLLSQTAQMLQLDVKGLTALQAGAKVSAPSPLETPSPAAPFGSSDSKKREASAGISSNANTKSRARNPIWDALSKAVGAPTTKSESSDFGKTVRELKEIGAESEQIAGFPQWWDREFPGASCTHRCYRLHWGKYVSALERRSSRPNELDL